MTNLRYGLYSPSEAFADYQLAIFHQCQVLAQYMLKYILHKLPQPVLQKTQKTNIGLVSNQMRTARGPVDWQDTLLEHRGAQKEPVKKEKYKKINKNKTCNLKISDFITMLLLSPAKSSHTLLFNLFHSSSIFLFR